MTCYCLYATLHRLLTKNSVRQFLFLENMLSCAPEEAFDKLGELLTAILPLKPLREYGMEEKHIHEFASNVLATQQRLLKNNYVPLSEEQIAAIYAARF